MELTTRLSKDNFKLFYLDRSGEIQEDHDSSLGGSEVLGEADQSYLTSKCAKRFGISSEQLETIQKISAFYLSGTTLSTTGQKAIKLFLNKSLDPSKSDPLQSR